LATRNDALTVIEDILETHLKDSLINKTVCADEILKGLEKKIGMLPPTTYLDHLKTYDNGWEED